MSSQLEKYYDLRAKCIMDGSETDLLAISRNLVANALVVAGLLCDQCKEHACRGCIANSLKRQFEEVVKADGFGIRCLRGNECTIVNLNRQGYAKEGGFAQ